LTIDFSPRNHFSHTRTLRVNTFRGWRLTGPERDEPGREKNFSSLDGGENGSDFSHRLASTNITKGSSQKTEQISQDTNLCQRKVGLLWHFSGETAEYAFVDFSLVRTPRRWKASASSLVVLNRTH
jgi:hypothetical protein